MATHALITGAPTRAPAITADLLIQFCAQHGIAQTRSGRDAVGDPRLIGDLRAYGRTLRPATVARIVSFMQETTTCSR